MTGWILFGIWFFIIAFWLFLIIQCIYKYVQDKKLLETVTKTYRGTRTERKLVLKLLKSGIPAQTIFHDLYVRKSDGKYSQIDVVVATKVGILVFEVKDYSGWIFGKGYQKQWTQVLSYGRQQYRFYNPVMQNDGHIAALRKQIKQFENVPFFSIIVFYGDCLLRDVSNIPRGTNITFPRQVLDAVNVILNDNENASYTDKYEVINVLKEAVQNGENTEIRDEHIRNVRNMLE
jgi:hypothetical protein